MRRRVAAGSVVLAALVLAGCGGGGGLGPREIAARIADKTRGARPTCVETTGKGKELRAFSCVGTRLGGRATYIVTENGSGDYAVVVLVGKQVADFFVLG